MFVFFVMFFLWAMTVWMEMFSWSAISLFVNPLATKTRTPFSLMDSSQFVSDESVSVSVAFVFFILDWMVDASSSNSMMLSKLLSPCVCT